MDGGYVKVPNSIVDKYSRFPDKLSAWVWVSRNRDYKTGKTTTSVRQLAGKFGWAHAKAQRFMAIHFRYGTDTPKPHEQRADKQNQYGTDTEPIHPDSETSLLTKIKETKLHNYHPPEWVPIVPWNAFMEVRKKKKAAQTEYALKLIATELEKLRSRGFDLTECLNHAINKSWTGFKSDWFTGSEVDNTLEIIRKDLES